MQVGIHIADFTGLGGVDQLARGLSEVARAAEEAGCRHISVMDHYFQMEGYADVTDPMLEGYSTLGYLAAVTERLKLHVLVTGVTYRHPGLLAKIVTTVDVLSGGRAELGIGAAWYEREHRGLGVPFPPLAERFERLEETVQIVRQMWSDDDGPYEGRHYRLAETLCSPRPLTRPSPPIIIGGDGEKKTLRLVARYADGCNLYGSSPADVAHKLDVLRRHCDDAGRDHQEITKTISYSGEWPTTPSLVDTIAEYAPLGIDAVILVPRSASPAADVERLGRDVVPHLADL